MNKQFVLIIPVALLAAVFFYRLSAENSELEARIASLDARMQQQLSQVEESSRQRLELERQLDSLRSQLTESRSRLTAMSNDLESARQQANPDYARMEEEIREQLAREYRQQDSGGRGSNAPLSRAELINELSALDPMEMAQLMALQGRYGAFVQSLNVDEQRKETIIDALNNYLSEQNDARRNIMMQSRVDGFDPSQIREQMQAINSPEARRESLSFALTEDELLALEQFEQANQQSGVQFRTGVLNRQAGDGTATAVFVDGGDFSLSPGEPVVEHIEIITDSDQ